ncbi:ADP-ribosylglycohydrolase [Nakamurella sp. UYEF19]|uniref:ADP-ribosylglycohydrolase family protein n=1 Tax=Nakamurella sp. UYEF19 TaxID=1756392 RepID=UPI0033983D7C
MTRLSWLQPEDLIIHEFAQAREEGKVVDDLVARWQSAGGATTIGRMGASPMGADDALVCTARELMVELDSRAVSTEMARDEPRDLANILATLPAPPPVWPVPPSDELADRMAGAWSGRAVGCLLGKPVEKITREGIEEILRSSGQWPLRGYFTAVGVPTDVTDRYPWNKASRPTSLAENIDGMPEDDDLNYTMLALGIVERVGPDFDTSDVADAWLRNLPATTVFTAERAAYRNLLDLVPIQQVAVTANPFREWIGAAIRADLYGWINPGHPAAAAEMAWRDASLSHTGSGLYSAMATAAMTSAAIAGAPPPEIVPTGLSVIPPQSRLADALRHAMDLAAGKPDDADALDALVAEHGHLHWVHALNNAALVAYAVTRHGEDFDAAISLTAIAGWDTDSTGATVGGLCGALGGRRVVSAGWTDPIHGRIASSLPGFDGADLADLARRTTAVALR